MRYKHADCPNFRVSWAIRIGWTFIQCIIALLLWFTTCELLCKLPKTLRTYSKHWYSCIQSKLIEYMKIRYWDISNSQSIDSFKYWVRLWHFSIWLILPSLSRKHYYFLSIFFCLFILYSFLCISLLLIYIVRLKLFLPKRLSQLWG